MLVTAMCEPHLTLGCEECKLPVIVTDEDPELYWSGGQGVPCQLKHEIHPPHGHCPGIEDPGLT